MSALPVGRSGSKEDVVGLRTTQGQGGAASFSLRSTDDRVFAPRRPFCAFRAHQPAAFAMMTRSQIVTAGDGYGQLPLPVRIS